MLYVDHFAAFLAPLQLLYSSYKYPSAGAPVDLLSSAILCRGGGARLKVFEFWEI